MDYEGMPAARKVYITGSRPDIRVPMREVELEAPNPSIQLYDTSGPYTDPQEQLDVHLGLAPRRIHLEPNRWGFMIVTRVESGRQVSHGL